MYTSGTRTCAEALAAEGEAYLKAAETAERPLDVLLSAHTSFDSAYLDGDEPGYLCRALDVTGRALQLPALADEQERKFWEETRREDLERLQRDAAEKRRFNCRYDAAGKPAQPRVALLAADDPPAAPALPTPLAVPPAAARRMLKGPSRRQVHRDRAHTAMGAVLTGAGVGMLGILAGILELERQRAVEVRGIIEAAKAERRGYTPVEERRYFELRDDLVRGRGGSRSGPADVAIAERREGADRAGCNARRHDRCGPRRCAVSQPTTSTPERAVDGAIHGVHAPRSPGALTVSPMLRPLLPALVSTLGLLALASGLTGCKPEYPACRKDKHCKAELGEKCVDKTCQECKADAECAGKGAGFVCKEFRCQDPALAGKTGPGGGEIGDPCVSQPDCTGGWACNEGKCAMCTDDAQCSPSTCNVETGRCSNTGQCQTDDMCQMDEICDGGTCVFSGAAGGTTGPCGLDAVYFGFDSDNVGDKQAEQLKALAACITQQNKNVVLEAHADSVGTEEYNILLTERRGTAVKQLLLDNGVPPALLQVISKGDLEAQGTTEDQRHKERRVQFLWP